VAVFINPLICNFEERRDISVSPSAWHHARLAAKLSESLAKFGIPVVPLSPVSRGGARLGMVCGLLHQLGAELLLWEESGCCPEDSALFRHVMANINFPSIGTWSNGALAPSKKNVSTTSRIAAKYCWWSYTNHSTRVFRWLNEV